MYLLNMLWIKGQTTVNLILFVCVWRAERHCISMIDTGLYAGGGGGGEGHFFG